MDKKPSYQQATESTAKDLRTVAKGISAHQLSRLSLPEVEAVVDLISKVIPAGNLPDCPVVVSPPRKCNRM
jgi:hypothetical protein